MIPLLKDILYIFGAAVVIAGGLWGLTKFVFATKFVTKDELMEHCQNHQTICHRQICGKIDSLTKLVEGHITSDTQKASRMDQRNIWIMRSMQTIADALNQLNKDGKTINLTDMPV